MWKRLAIVGLVLVLTSNAVAYAQKAAIGPGGMLCSDWLKASDQTKAPEAFWILGFLSGANIWGNYNDFLAQIAISHTPSEKLFLWIDDFCRTNPTAPIYAGANTLACDLAGAHGNAWCNLSKGGGDLRTANPGRLSAAPALRRMRVAKGGGDGQSFPPATEW